MKRSTTRWTTAFAATALLGLPAAGWTQTPPATTPPTSQRAQAPQGSAQEHIRQAKAALDDVQTASLAARSKTRISELKRHLNSLEKSATESTNTAAKTTARAKSNWATEVAAIDKILTELLGPATTTPAGASTGATGTTGKAGPASSAAATLDDATKAKLMEVRTHITAFAGAMSGTGSPSEPASDPAAASPAQPAASPGQSLEPAPASSQPQMDAAAAKQHLMDARDSLSQLTQLPAAAQLTGETRTQVSQLIANFNEMIGATTNWRASYDKVNANLTALVGAESASAPQPAQSGTPGAVGTSGAAAGTLDPTLNAKLVEFRDHLMKFEQAAGGAGAGSDAPLASESTAAPTASPASPSATPSSSESGMPTRSAPSATPAEQTPATNPPSATAPRSDAMSQSSAVRHIEAIEAILSGRPAGSGRTAAGSTPAATPPSSATAGTSGASASVTLTASQLEQIRMHLSELRKAVDKK